MSERAIRRTEHALKLHAALSTRSADEPEVEPVVPEAPAVNTSPDGVVIVRLGKRFRKELDK